MTSEKAARANRLKSAIGQMLSVNETISTRNIMKRLPEDFSYPSAITRPPELRAIYLQGQTEQKRIRVAAQTSHNSTFELQAKIARQASKIDQLQGQVELLVASHRAMYAAIGELGGAKAWLRFFDKQQAALQTLEGLQANPTKIAELTSYSHTG